MLTNNQLLVAKVEATVGSDSSPTAASNSIKCSPVDARLDFSPLSLAEVRRSLSSAKTRIGRKLINFSVTCNLKGSGAAGTPPEISPLLQACGFAEAINSGTSVVYTPESTSSSMKAATIYFYYDGRVRKAVGCMGNVSITANPGELPLIVFNMRGRFLAEADAALPTDQVFQSSEPVVVENAGMSFGSFNDAVVSALSFQSGNVLIDRRDVNSPEGIKSISITGRDPKLSATVEATVEATKAWFGNFEDRVEEAIDVTIGTVAGNIVTLAFPKFCVDGGVDPQNSDGMVVFSLTGQTLENTGGDNVTLTFA
ncbi:MAG: hypothetical protein HQM10_26520 [Candidatus Riflebacteria bacterium]|nr:hypothetical protein [Candidatus Riflebacteria bacterium]